MKKIRVAITDDRRILRCRLLIQLIELCGAEAVIIPRNLKPSSVGLKHEILNKTIKPKAIAEATSSHLEHVKSLIETCDAILLPGNRHDIHPNEYGEKNIHPETQKRLPTNPLNKRFETETLMAKYAINERHMPILGICGGFQVVNVALGGSLIQHLPEHPRTNERKLPHRDPSLKHLPKEKQEKWEENFVKHILQDKPKNIYPATHEMNVIADSLLGHLYKKVDRKIDLSSIDELSIHHQGCFESNLGKGLIATAFAPDGVIEAAELDNHPMCLITQFHLECNVSGIAKAAVQELINRSRR